MSIIQTDEEQIRDKDIAEAIEHICLRCPLIERLLDNKECESLLIAEKGHREGFNSKLILCLSDRERGTLTYNNGYSLVYKDLIQISLISHLENDMGEID